MIEIEIFNHQEDIPMGQDLLEGLQKKAQLAFLEALKFPINGGGVLKTLSWLEISFVSDTTIAQVHHEFMDVAGATDVITFDHGEIIISVQTALTQSARYDNSWQRELLLYIIHGLLHLIGHKDHHPSDRAVMEQAQFEILDLIEPKST